MLTNIPECVNALSLTNRPECVNALSLTNIPECVNALSLTNVLSYVARRYNTLGYIFLSRSKMSYPGQILFLLLSCFILLPPCPALPDVIPIGYHVNVLCEDVCEDCDAHGDSEEYWARKHTVSDQNSRIQLRASWSVAQELTALAPDS
uniref:Uncharacterized protein n=1 Tax=Timema genevievae TaxID=629358 RepID=A0A7R9PP10_TIMGE|nr:unnamed protein product [Timema genevievae]